MPAAGEASTRTTTGRPTESELRIWIQECITDVCGREEFTVLEARQSELLLLFGLVGRTARFADGYLKLCELECMSEAVPLARVALEHAVTAQWGLFRPSQASAISGTRPASTNCRTRQPL